MPRTNVHRACDDFHQTSEATRRSFAAGVTRRQVIGTGLAAGVAVYAARALPFARILQIAEADAQANPNAPVLVSVFLPGGCALLDTLVPHSQFGTYADLRPGLKIADAPALGGTGLGI